MPATTTIATTTQVSGTPTKARAQPAKAKLVTPRPGGISTSTSASSTASTTFATSVAELTPTTTVGSTANPFGWGLYAVAALCFVGVAGVALLGLRKKSPTKALKLQDAHADKVLIKDLIVPHLDVQPQFFVDKFIFIQAPVAAVWRVFTDRVVSKKMGGFYTTSWKPGSAFGWSGLDGTVYTKGTLLQLEQNKLLQHTLLVEDSKLKKDVLYSTITYELREEAGGTKLKVFEEFADKVDDDEMTEAKGVWDAALKKIKELAEGLRS